MRLRQVSLLLPLSLLTSAATAHAQNAWVLWERWSSQGAGDSWTAVSNEVSEWACARASESEYAQARGRACKMVGVRGFEPPAPCSQSGPGL